MGEGPEVISRLIQLLGGSKAKATRAALISFLLFGGVGVAFLFGAPLLGIDGANTVKLWLGSAPRILALPITVAAFAGLAFIGVPQVALIGASVAVFGPWSGLVYSWLGTLVSSLIGYGLGRRFGGRLLEQYAGARVQKVMQVIGDNGFLASFMIRQVPFAPFVVVNMAAGVAGVRFVDFLIGTGLGILPKIVVICFFGNSLAELIHGRGMDPLHIVLLLAGLAVWLGAGWAARNWLRRRDNPRQDLERRADGETHEDV